MVKIYGSSGSEKRFLDAVNSRLKGCELNSLDEFEEYKSDPLKWEKELIDEKEFRVKSCEDENVFLKKENVRNKIRIERIVSKINLRNKTVLKNFGEIKEKAQNKVDELEYKKSKIEKNLKRNRDKLVQNTKDTQNTKKVEIKTIMENYKHNAKEIKLIQKDKELLNLITKSHSENLVIKRFQESFRSDNLTYLINGLNLNMLNKNSRKPNIIDHLFISKKGVFLFEITQQMKITPKVKAEIRKRLENLGKAFKTKFKDIVKINPKVTLISAREEIKLDGFKTLNIDNLKKYISDREEILSNDDLTIILNEVLKYTHSISTIDTLSIKTKKVLVDVKEYINKKFNEISNKP